MSDGPGSTGAGRGRPGSFGVRWLVGFLFCLALAGCQIETRAPQGAPPGETAQVEKAVASFYASLLSPEVDSNESSFGAATLLLTAAGSEPVLISRVAFDGVPERRALSPGVRVIRTEVRIDRELASVRAVIASREAGDSVEYEASDFLTMGRRNGTWQVAHALFGTWHPRSSS